MALTHCLTKVLMPKSIWELEEEVRRQLRSGVDLGGRVVGASVGTDMFTWVKLERDRLVVAYLKDTYMLTVTAAVRDGGERVEILSLSLDRLCGCGVCHA
jgi:hypothetical protein